MEYGLAALNICLFGVCLLIGSVYSLEWPTVRTKEGMVRGMRTSVHGTEVDVYYGIPYAKPPVGELRFRHPQIIDKWDDVKDATEKPNACWQGLDIMYPDFPGSKMWAPNTNMSEDCLYLNVWVPNPRSSNIKKHVMVWIFGGGFVTGSAVLDVYDGKYLAAEENVIIVSMQYRLGALGFLYLGGNEATGNAGMFDQVMALGWVHDNIDRFGGDSDSVTLFGESAGGASVGMHMLSPLSQRYFHRAIIQSAGPHAAWATLTDKEILNRSTKLAIKLGCDMKDPNEIIDCLQAIKTPEVFPNTEYEVFTYGVVRFPFVPRVDGVFLTEPPEESLNKNNYKKCPLLLGHNTNEASFWLTYFEPDYFKNEPDSKITRTDYDLLIDTLFEFHPYYPKLLNEFGKEAIRFFYRNWINPDDGSRNVWQIDMAVGDFNFICPAVDLAQHYASTGNKVYYYVFDHRSSTNHWPNWMGVLHGDEIMFVFGEPLNHSKRYTREEKLFARKMMKYWTNFAKTGNPNRAPGGVDMDEWPLYTNTSREHLILRSDLINNLDKSKAIQQGSRVRECAFWKEYLPDLMMTTESMSDLEVEWKIQFNEWSTKYIVEWKKQFNSFMDQQRVRDQVSTCDGPLQP